MQKKEPLERLVADIPRNLKRRVTAKGALQGLTLKDVVIKLFEDYVEGFEATGYEDDAEEEETAMLALAA